MKGQETLEFSVIDRFDALLQLEAEWNAFWNSLSGPYVSQSFAWCAQSWREVASKRGHELFCLVGRSTGQIVLIWPMMISRRYGIKMIAPLGPEGSEYSLVLCAPGPNEADWVQRAFEFVRHRSRADLMHLRYVPRETALGKSLAKLRGFRFSTANRISWVSWEGVTDWQTYLGRVPQLQTRQRRRRNLVKQGKFCFELIEDHERAAATLDWFLTYKYRWMETTGKTNAWLPKQDYVGFLRSLIVSTESGPHLSFFRITIDSKIVAASLVAIAPARVELLNKTHDPAWDKYSPGLQLDEDIVRWCFERGLIYDFRLGDEAYKRDWCNRFESLATVTIALTLKGTPFVALLHLREIWRYLKKAFQRIQPRWLANSPQSAPAA